jgi:hypothetical protein
LDHPPNLQGIFNDQAAGPDPPELSDQNGKRSGTESEDKIAGLDKRYSAWRCRGAFLNVEHGYVGAKAGQHALQTGTGEF